MIFLLWACSGATPLDSASDSATVDPGDGLDLLVASEIPQGEEPCREPELATLESVVDGDTAWFTTTSGSELVRFIGIDTPEVSWDSDPGECYGEEASAQARELLSGGRAWLSFDAECHDHYDRLLSYIHVGLEEKDFLQRSLLQDGFATAFAVEPNTYFRTIFSQDESLAEDAVIGLWEACGR